MHYYQFNIADYRKDTIHLSHLEHGIYRQLLDEYYLNEKPIKTQQVIRRLRILTQEEKTALENVLDDFFEHDAQEDSWLHKRAEESLEAYKAKAEISRVNGSKGGRPKKPTKTQQVNSWLPNKTQEKGNHEPLTINHKPLLEGDKSPTQLIPDKPKKTNSRFVPPTVEQVADYCAQKNYRVDPKKFVDYYASSSWYRGKTKISNWKACVNTWASNDKSYASPAQSLAPKNLMDQL